MNFWSDVEKEYNELSGDPQKGGEEEDGDSKLSNPEFDGLVSDIKKDLKRIPKGEVFPSFSPKDNDEENDNENDSDSDQDEGRRSLNKKRDKRCRVGEKLYEIGERWRDEKTGKNMMCILMNIPKDVQPLLADAEDVLSTNTTLEQTTPSEEPQWSYTATPKCQEASDLKTTKTQEKKESSPKDKKKPVKEKEIGAPTEQPKQIPEITEPSIKDNAKENLDASIKKQGKQGEKETLKPGKEPIIIVVDSPETKLEQVLDNTKDKEKEDEDDDSESESESEENKPQISKDSNHIDEEPQSISKQQNGKDDKETKEVEGDSSDDSESETANEREDKRLKNNKNGKNDIKSEAIKENSKEDSTKDENITNKDIKKQGPLHATDDLTKINENTKEDSKTVTDIQDNNEGQSPESQNDSQTEKGEQIYTKETVVVQRKLIKTEQTIETTETDKTKK